MAVSVALLKLPVLLLPRCPDQRAAETRPRARRHHLRYELCCGCFWQIVLGLGVVGVVGVVVPCAPARLPFAFCSRSSRTHSHSHSHTLTLTLTHTHTLTHSLTCSSLMSAGTRSPVLSITTSPGTEKKKTAHTIAAFLFGT